VSQVDNTRFLSFRLGAEEYAIPLLNVKEVIAVPEFTPVPQTPGYFVGIMNLRGQIISAIDLRTKLGIKPSESEEESVIILDLQPNMLGIVVDSVNSVIAPLAGEVAEPPKIDGHKNAESITGVYTKDKSIVLILDVQRTLSKDDKNVLGKASMPKAV
jgi:purine-binding chemotaxis protein CheW